MRIVVVALVVAGALVAAASSLAAFDRSGVGAGGGVLTACDTNGVRTSFTTEWDPADARYEISEVTVSGIADACDGRTLSVALTGAEEAEASTTIPTSPATSVAVSPTPGPAVESVETVHVVIGD